MALERSTTSIYCQECGSAWPLDDDVGQYYFRGSGPAGAMGIGEYNSPKSIADADPAQVMTFCPKCDTDELAVPYRKPTPGIQESPFYEGDSRMAGSESEVDPPDDGIPPTSTHTP